MSMHMARSNRVARGKGEIGVCACGMWSSIALFAVCVCKCVLYMYIVCSVLSATSKKISHMSVICAKL